MVEPQDLLPVVLVDRVEQRLAGAVVVGLQAQEPCDGGASGRRAVELEDVVEVGDQPPLGLAVGEDDRVAALDPVLALDGLLLAHPVARVLIGGAQAGRAVGAGGLDGDRVPGDDREAGQEAEHDDEAGQAGADDPAVLVSVGCRHAVTACIRRADTLLDARRYFRSSCSNPAAVRGSTPCSLLEALGLVLVGEGEHELLARGAELAGRAVEQRSAWSWRKPARPPVSGSVRLACTGRGSPAAGRERVVQRDVGGGHADRHARWRRPSPPAAAPAASSDAAQQAGGAPRAGTRVERVRRPRSTSMSSARWPSRS